MSTQLQNINYSSKTLCLTEEIMNKQNQKSLAYNLTPFLLILISWVDCRFLPDKLSVYLILQVTSAEYTTGASWERTSLPVN